MVEKRKKDKEKKGPANPPKVEAAAARAAHGAALLVIRGVGLLAVLSVGYTLNENGAFYSETEKKMSIMVRLFFFFLTQATAAEFFAMLMLNISRRLLGENKPFGAEMTPEERTSHDSTIHWPPKELLCDNMKVWSDRKGQPFFLNHVSGTRRFKDACMRFGMAVGSLLSVFCTSRWLDRRPLSVLGLTFDTPFWQEVGVGFIVGCTIVSAMFAVELKMGWIRFLRFFEVFKKSENFATCILWDVLFHINVAINEEVPVRGWLLFNLTEAFSVHFGIAQTTAFVAALIFESLFFVMMHLPSPGGSGPRSMINIFVGGMVAGINVLLTGGRLGFALGWHFGWNITMGNVLGLSTSGIPVSASFISIVPHPEKEKLHGGTFGPEGGVVAPFGYGLGVVLLYLVYGGLEAR